MKCDIYHPFHPPHPTMFLITLLLSTYVFFLFDNVLSSVRAGLMCMGMGPSEYGKPTSDHSLWKKKFSFPKLLPIASVKAELKDYLLHLCFDLRLAWSCTGLKKVTTAALNSWFPQSCHAHKSTSHSLSPHSFCLHFLQCSLSLSGGEINIDVLFGG